MIKLTVVITEEITFTNYIYNFIQYYCLKVNAICRWNYFETSVWTETKQLNY